MSGLRHKSGIRTFIPSERAPVRTTMPPPGTPGRRTKENPVTRAVPSRLSILVVWHGLADGGLPPARRIDSAGEVPHDNFDFDFYACP